MSDDLRKTVFGSRDTQFQGFAQLLFTELSQLGLVALVDVSNFQSKPHYKSNFDRALVLQDEMNSYTRKIIAQRAYDLVAHTIDCMKPYIYDDKIAGQESVADVPDLTQWPKSPELQDSE